MDILGFKSFANKTTIKFSNGVTAIVGPNGCGKTNVLDALRWVLGEQRPTLLRGGKMEEVIFNGTRDMKPLGMSEVTLTILNDKGVLPTAYHEVQVTRRLFRSGDSEYLLNKVPCRLKDISDLFTDTGMGAHSYSVIQQEMIDSVISDKAEERRFLFEEAAGITKYKQRKKAALRKLEATENDFLRLKDIYAEVKTQVNSLFRQHKKAERYQKIADDIKAWELALGSKRVKTLGLEKRELRAEFDLLSDQRLGKSAELDTHQAQLENDRNEQLDLERKLNEIGAQIYAEAERIHQLERQIEVSREKRSGAQALVEKNRVEITALSTRIDFLKDQVMESSKEMAEQQNQLMAISSDLKEAEGRQAEADRQLLSARAVKEAENRKLIELEGRLSSGKTEESSLREQETELARQLSEVDAQTQEMSPSQQTLLTEHEKAGQRLNSLLNRRTEIEQEQSSLTSELERLVELNEELALEIANTAASVEACEARRNLLKDMMLHYEGHESGLVAAMSEHNRWPGIAGTVAEKFVPVAGLEIALEAALGDIAGFLICYDRGSAESIISYLKAEKKGKAGILVPDAGTLNPAIRRPEIALSGFIGWLESFVSTDDDLRVLKDAVLSRTAVFRSGSDPNEILERLPYGFSAVSSDGVYYSKNVISGGSDDHFPLFRRKEKVEEQEHQIATLTERLDALREQKNRTTAQIASTRATSSGLIETLEGTLEEIDGAQKALAEIDFQRRTLAGDFDRLDKQRMYLRSRLEAIRGRQYSLGLDFDQLSTMRNSLAETMLEVANRLDEFEKESSGTLERVAKLQVAVVEARSRVEQSQSRLTHIDEIKCDIETTLRVKQEEIDQAVADDTLCTQRIGESEQELKKAFERRDEHSSRQTVLRGVQAELLDRATTRERRMKEVRDERDCLGEQVHHLEIRLNSIESEVRGISEKMRQEYEIDIEEVSAPSPDETISEEGARDRLQQNRELLRKFGAVNLLALEEYRTASAREKFLGEQLADLTTAKSDLQATITKINQTARQLFMETFEKARANFKNLFIELFSGGEADITLDDPTDPLESNIDITARPRGKKLLSITMMSGGERALTAISLLFSLYLVKPSPFCILDEIDAPLDDANCGRFLKIIKKFSDQTQFITITHNKITMEAADNLYGITMEQPGISKLVAVKFAEGNGDSSGPVVVQTDASMPEEDYAIATQESALPEAIQKRLHPDLTITDDVEQ